MTTMREYQMEFKKLANCTEVLDEGFFHSFFISGIKEEIRAKVKMFNPSNMTSIIRLSKLVEDKFSAQ